MTLRQGLALPMVLLLATDLPRAPRAVLGVVVVAYRAQVNASEVSEGSTVYDGDRFSTGTGGVLRLRGVAVTLDLAEESMVFVRSEPSGRPGTEVELSKG